MNGKIIQLRRDLHQYPELSGCERETAKKIVQFFVPLRPDEIIEDIGGTGIAVIFKGKKDGPKVLLRCELDAVPVQEKTALAYGSKINGVSHQCGHDGHMAILAAVGEALSLNRPQNGQVILLFQPAEENGQGASAVIQDSVFDAIKPHYAFALHNVPGYPLGQIIVRPGAFNCASRGMTIEFQGSTAHAAQPETGKSPAEAMCRLIPSLSNLPLGIIPADKIGFATVVGAELGKKAFGTSPDKALIWTTLRTQTDDMMDRLVQYAEKTAGNLASEYGLETTVTYEDIFTATTNSKTAFDMVKRIAGTQNLYVPEKPFPWSEDFGQITALCDGALIGIGAGVNSPDLHNPNYNFPENLIPISKSILLKLVESALAEK